MFVVVSVQRSPSQELSMKCNFRFVCMCILCLWGFVSTLTSNFVVIYSQGPLKKYFEAHAGKNIICCLSIQAGVIWKHTAD